MKNLSLILNAVLLVAVGVLYYLHFSGPRSSATTAAASTPTDLKIAYIVSDSVLNHYEYFKVVSAKLEATGRKAQQDLRNRAQALQNDIEAYQRNANSLTIGQAKSLEEDLGRKQQNLEMQRQASAQQLNDEQLKVTQDIYARVTEFLKKYGADNGLQVVFKFDQSSDVLFGNSGLDITKPVTDGLNEAYKLELSSPTKKDSTSSKAK